MSLAPGQQIELQVEKPASGGRMIARHEGQVVLVLGAIPGERVIARVERADRRLAFARATAVLDASEDRRVAVADPLCGGCLYAHIQYARQRALKSEVIGDAFLRIGRIPLTGPVPVAGSPEQGYRMRARLHVRGDRVGFYREGTHDLCDASATSQLRRETIEAAARAVRDAAAAAMQASAVEVSENIAGDQIGMQVELTSGGHLSAGDPSVADPLHVLTNGRAPAGELRRTPSSFFQANRYLLPQLVAMALDRVLPEGGVLDLYAGVGLFSIALAGSGRTGIIAVEGDRSAGADLAANAEQFGGQVRAMRSGVEEYLSRQRGAVEPTLIVDPPRTGISRAAMEAIARCGAQRIVYVSCDPPTMARDARRLLDGGYRLVSLDGFDLFPNTPHVETVGVLDRA